MILDIFPVTLRLLLASLLFQEDSLQAQTPRLSFHLRHQHAVTNTSRVIFSDVGQSQLLSHSLSTPADPYTYDVDTSHLLTHRPSSYAAFHDARLRSMRYGQSDAALWNPEEVLGPDVTDRETLLSLAKMSNNAYTASPDAGWYNIDGFNMASYFSSAIFSPKCPHGSSRRSLWDGSPTMMASVATFLWRKIIPRSFFPLRVPLLGGSLAEEVPRCERTSLTITCSFPVVARVWVLRGAPSVAATRAQGSAVNNA